MEQESCQRKQLIYHGKPEGRVPRFSISWVAAVGYGQLDESAGSPIRLR